MLIKKKAKGKGRKLTLAKPTTLEPFIRVVATEYTTHA